MLHTFGTVALFVVIFVVVALLRGLHRSWSPIHPVSVRIVRALGIRGGVGKGLLRPIAAVTVAACAVVAVVGLADRAWFATVLAALLGVYAAQILRGRA